MLSVHATARLRRLVAIAGMGCCAVLAAVAAPAHAEYGDHFGIADAAGPALPGARAWWAGTCDTTSSAAAVGTAPANAADCIDIGTPNPDDVSLAPWATPPSWRRSPVTQAGAHPDATTTLWFRRGTRVAPGFPGVDGNVKDTTVAIPVGLSGNPTATPTCPAEAIRLVPPACPPETQVGIATNVLHGTQWGVQRTPIYNVEARDGRTAEFVIAAAANATNIPLIANVRTGGDDGITITVPRIPASAPLHAATITLWGDPWAAAHDRWRPATGAAYVGTTVQPVDVGGVLTSGFCRAGSSVPTRRRGARPGGRASPSSATRRSAPARAS